MRQKSKQNLHKLFCAYSAQRAQDCVCEYFGSFSVCVCVSFNSGIKGKWFQKKSRAKPCHSLFYNGFDLLFFKVLFAQCCLLCFVVVVLLQILLQYGGFVFLVKYFLFRIVLIKAIKYNSSSSPQICLILTLFPRVFLPVYKSTVATDFNFLALY